MIQPMLGKLFSRRIAALFLALGMLLGVAAPAWAAMSAKAPSDMSMMMPGMAMSGDCMDMAQHDGKNLPAKNSHNSCGICVACGLPISGALLSQGLYRSGEAAFTLDVNRDGIAILPALPPPIA
jgi:hypothetical protein